MVLALVVACGDDSTLDEDASTGPDCGGMCDDGLFCNGEESCDPDSVGADASGCVPGDPPCAAGMCDEAASRCEGDCAQPDVDGDGHASVECGGDDCDDNDPERYPSNTEVCDDRDVDEDCDGATFGGKDSDGDGVVDAGCCNGDRCGEDCDDTRPTSNPTAPEVCDGVDNDCDGSLDEGVLETYYRDVDGDRFGDETMSMMACTAPTGWVLGAGDCNDRDGAVRPTADEICDGMDNNCSGTPDDLPGGCSCTEGQMRPCGSTVGECSEGVQTCSAAGTYGDCEGGVRPALEESFTCNGQDDDCDGMTDEGINSEAPAGAPTWYLDTDGDGYGRTGPTRVACSQPAGYAPNDADCVDMGAQGALINPGATFQSRGHCSGNDPCTNVFTGGPGCVECLDLGGCSCRAQANFDYNCNGLVEVQPTPGCSSSGAGCGGGAKHPVAGSDAGDCGTDVMFASCCIDCTRACGPETRPLPCR